VSSDALVAQPDRASDYESEGRRFESCRARSGNTLVCRKTVETKERRSTDAALV
jgi:hypothetical protein